MYRGKPFRLSRRAFLGGAAAAISLPMLEAMLPKAAYAQAGGTPRRMLCYYTPNGFHMPAFTPGTEGTGYALAKSMFPLRDLAGDMLVLTGLENKAARPDGPGDHAAGTGSFLTAFHVNKTSGTDIENGISVDQMAANAIGDQTPYRSLQLGLDAGGSVGDCDGGYSCTYTQNISWAGPQTPLPNAVDPQLVFDRLFAGADAQATADQQRKRQRYNQSILDFAREDARKLQEKLGARDRAKLDEYLTGIRELENRITALDSATLCGVPERPGGSYDVDTKADVMSDLMVLAFQCDLTRVQSFMLANSGSQRVYDFLGISETHHQISHHRGVRENFDALEIVNAWEMKKFGYLLQKLKDTPDGEGGSLLDNTVVFMSSEVSDGDLHNHDNLPVILAGMGGNGLNSGRHVRYDGDPPIANLFISMLDLVGVEVDRFGQDGTGRLPHLT